MGKDKNAGSRAASEANRLTQKGIEGLQPFLEAGTGQLPALEAGATAGGLGDRIGEILGIGQFQPLVDERTRAAQGQLSAGGLTRSGTALETIADIPTDLAFQIEQLLTGRSQQLAGQGVSAGGGIANLFQNQGQVASQGILTDASTRASGIGGLFKGLAGIGKAAFGAGGLGKLASGIFFSDERLKTDIMQIGSIAPLGLYEWDWIPEAKDTVVWNCPRVGFLAGEVERVYPHLVLEYAGWKVVNYVGVLAELQANLDRKIASEAVAA